ncbi:MAG: T9SS type A sorting domain-containing protein [Agriterribacter sp.]
MTKKSTIALLCIIACNLLHAQGVKQLWGLHTFQDRLVSFDTIRKSFTTRTQFDPNSGPLDFAVLKGKIYGTQLSGSFLYEFDPLAASNNFRTLVPVERGDGASLSPVSHLTIKDNMLYGVADIPIRIDHSHEPDYTLYEYAPVYSWNPATQHFTELLNGDPAPMFGRYGRMTEWNGKFYGVAIYGESGTGSIYSFDPATNQTKTEASLAGIDLMTTAYDSYRTLLLVGDKFYGLGLNALYEWDPAGTAITILHTFDNPAEGQNAIGSLIEKNAKLYGTVVTGGTSDQGGIFEYDLAQGTYNKKINFGDHNLSPVNDFILTDLGDHLYGFGQDQVVPDPNDPNAPYERLFKWNPSTNDFEIISSTAFTSIRSGLKVVPAPVSMFTAGSCTAFPAVIVDAANSNSWVPVTDSKGDVLAEIQPHNNNLGALDVQAYLNNGVIRTDGAGKPYADRNITITPAAQPAAGSPVDIRLYITKAEFEALKAAPNAAIVDISDVAIFRSSEACTGTISVAEELVTTWEDYEFGYVLKASIPSFSTFYFSKRTSGTLPLQLLDFSGTVQNDDVALDWITEYEQGTRSFDIERSTDGRHFSVIGNVPAKNTTGKHAYHFTDRDAFEISGTVLYYRLNQKDFDGKAVFSKVISIAIPAAKFITISPNPAGQYINVKLRKQSNSSGTTIQVIDMGGKKLIEQKITPTTNISRINISMLPKGAYMISIVTNGERTTSRFVKE